MPEYGPDLLGDQARAEIVRVLEQEPLEAPLLRCVCRFLWLGGKGDLPPTGAAGCCWRGYPKAVTSAKRIPAKRGGPELARYNAPDEETTAEWMSEAIKSTASAGYSRRAGAP